jgi:hypothetical protein
MGCGAVVAYRWATPATRFFTANCQPAQADSRTIAHSDLAVGWIIDGKRKSKMRWGIGILRPGQSDITLLLLGVAVIAFVGTDCTASAREHAKASRYLRAISGIWCNIRAALHRNAFMERFAMTADNPSVALFIRTAKHWVYRHPGRGWLSLFAVPRCGWKLYDLRRLKHPP